jgi:hypothetical protein
MTMRIQVVASTDETCCSISTITDCAVYENESCSQRAQRNKPAHGKSNRQELTKYADEYAGVCHKVRHHFRQS